MSGLRARFHLERANFTLDVALELPGRGLSVVFGPSGSGKTTLLRCLAGLERASGGLLQVNGDCWQDESRRIFLPTHRRHLGYVFQEASLFSHLTVRRNLEYGLRRTPVAARRLTMAQAADLLGLEPLMSRGVGRLSGGERQRVSLGRALLTSPSLLLMDEPLSNLDLASRAEILPYLEVLPQRLNLPVVYVTHSPNELMRLADTVVLLEEGRILATGPLEEMLTRLDLPLSHQSEAGAVVEAEVMEHDQQYNLTRLQFSGGSLLISRQPFARGHRLRVHINPRDVSLALVRPEASSILNVLPARVLDFQEESPGRVIVRLDCSGTVLLSRITSKSAHLLKLNLGLNLFIQIKSVALVG